MTTQRQRSETAKLAIKTFLKIGCNPFLSEKWMEGQRLLPPKSGWSRLWLSENLFFAWSILPPNWYLWQISDKYLTTFVTNIRYSSSIMSPGCAHLRLSHNCSQHQNVSGHSNWKIVQLQWYFLNLIYFLIFKFDLIKIFLELNSKMFPATPTQSLVSDSYTCDCLHDYNYLKRHYSFLYHTPPKYGNLCPQIS